jgi:hypothetical protein
MARSQSFDGSFGQTDIAENYSERVGPARGRSIPRRPGRLVTQTAAPDLRCDDARRTGGWARPWSYKMHYTMYNNDSVRKMLILRTLAIQMYRMMLFV